MDVDSSNSSTCWLKFLHIWHVANTLSEGSIKLKRKTLQKEQKNWPSVPQDIFSTTTFASLVVEVWRLHSLDYGRSNGAFLSFLAFIKKRRPTTLRPVVAGSIISKYLIWCLPSTKKLSILHQNMDVNPKIGVSNPPKWMVYNGKPY